MKSLLILTISLFLISWQAQDDEAARNRAARAGSLLNRPIYLGDEPPPMRAARNIVILHEGVSQRVAEHSSKRTVKQALALAQSITDQLREGADFGELARQHSWLPNARTGAHVGAYPQGMLSKPMDEFLWSAEIGEISDPLETVLGIQVMTRVEARCAVLQIFLRGEGAKERIVELRERALAGEDFSALASEHSDDEESKARGGRYGIFVRGARDNLVKAAAFGLPVGGISEPVETPIGWHIVKRVDLKDLDPSLEERSFVRVRAILVSFRGAVGAPDGLERTKEEAYDVATQIHTLIVEGDPMEKYAKSEYQDDPGGRERAGDLGWVYRRNPDIPVFMNEMFLIEPGTMLEPRETSAGYAILRREK